MRRRAYLTCLLVAAAACSRPAGQPPPPAGAPVVFEGARVIPGDGAAPLEDATFIVDNGTFVRVGPRGGVAVPDGASRVDLTGKTVMPALIDLHSHLGYTNVRDGSTSAANYTRENLIDNLQRYGYYGLAATLSLGLDRGEVAFQLREETVPGAARYLLAGRGIAPPNAGPRADYWRDAPYGVTTETEARQAVGELAAAKVDFVKIWVDDRNGTVPKLSRPMYTAIIEEAHRLGLRVVAHVYYLEDAKGLLRAGVDGFAHGIRDAEVDQELIDLLGERPDVFLIPNLPDRAPSLDELDWLAETLPPGQIAARREALGGGRPVEPALFAVQARSLMKLATAGVRIGFGTDAGTGLPIGWSAHAELADLVAAGMTPAQAITAATRTSAEILGLDDLGTIAAGKSADFIVLDRNPLDEVTSTRRIDRVYLRGNQVDRAALRQAWTGSTPE